MTTWIKVHNTMPHHPKLLKAGDRAAWVHLCGLCYSNEHLTNGFVSRHILAAAAPGVKHPEALAQRLVDAGLWREVEDGWQIHGYTEYQRSAEEIRERRAADSARKAAARTARSPRGQIADSARNPVGVRAVDVEVEVDVEGREQTAEPATQAARKRVTRQPNQTQPPKDFPADLLPTVDSVLTVLHRAWDARGGIEPMVRGVALGILRNPRADHVRVALKLEQWLTSGNGRRAQCKDVCARFGDWVENEGAALKVVGVGGNPKDERQARRLAALDRMTNGGAA